MIVVSEKIWTPQQFAEVITGHRYIFDGDDDVGYLASILEESGYGDLWDYDLNDIDRIIQHGHQVVLVDCMSWCESQGQYEHDYHWWQIPNNAVQKFQNKKEN
jgi:hypothetical protein